GKQAATAGASNKSAEYSGYIRDSGMHLLQLVNDILAFAKLESGTHEVAVEPVRVDLVAQEVARMLLPLAQAREVTIEIEAADEPVAKADTGAVRQVLLNLAGNA